MKDEFGGFIKEPKINFEKKKEEKGKVIPFPKKGKGNLPITPKGWDDKIKDYKIKFTNFLIERHVLSLREKLRLEGVDLSDPSLNKDFFLVEDAFRSMLYKKFALPYPWQSIADDMVLPVKKETKKKTTPPDIIA